MNNINDLEKILIDINKEEYISGEGDKQFNIGTFLKIRKLIEECRDKKILLSLNEKMSISNYLTTGEHLKEDINKYYTIFPITIRTEDFWIHNMFFERIYGIGANVKDLYKYVGDGEFILDMEKTEEVTDNFLLNYYESETIGGKYFKAGKVMKLLFKDIDFRMLI
jgi:hypothetical protein